MFKNKKKVSPISNEQGSTNENEKVTLGQFLKQFKPFPRTVIILCMLGLAISLMLALYNILIVILSILLAFWSRWFINLYLVWGFTILSLGIIGAFTYLLISRREQIWKKFENDEDLI